MRLYLALALLLQLVVAPHALAVSGYLGDYLAAGPTFGFSQFDEGDALHSGFELSVGRVDSHIGYGVWLDYQHTLESLDQDRVGVGLQVMTGEVAALGLELGALAVRSHDAWELGGRARAFLSAGWLGVAGGVGMVTNLGAFTEVSLLLKVPFSCDISGALPFRCKTSPY